MYIMEIRLNAKCPRQWYRFVIELGHFGECANLLQYRENNEFRKNNPSLKKSPISQVCRRGGVNPRIMPRFTRKVAVATTSFADLARFNEINHFIENFNKLSRSRFMEGNPIICTMPAMCMEIQLYAQCPR